MRLRCALALDSCRQADYCAYHENLQGLVLLGGWQHAQCCTSDAMMALQIGTLESGEIDYDELRDTLAANSSRPAILNVNIGTTVRGAVDDLDRVLQILTVRRCVRLLAWSQVVGFALQS